MFSEKKKPKLDQLVNSEMYNQCPEQDIVDINDNDVSVDATQNFDHISYKNERVSPSLSSFLFR